VPEFGRPRKLLLCGRREVDRGPTPEFNRILGKRTSGGHRRSTPTPERRAQPPQPNFVIFLKYFNLLINSLINKYTLIYFTIFITCLLLTHIYLLQYAAATAAILLLLLFNNSATACMDNNNSNSREGEECVKIRSVPGFGGGGKKN
jgi:hypothetical protein